MRDLIKELALSPVALGADHFGTAVEDETAARILDAFADRGGRLIDTANVYGKWVPGAGNASERFLGRWLKSRRKDVVIATKGAHYDLGSPTIMRLSAAEIRTDLDESRAALGLDCLDLYWLHRDDLARPIGEILETMEALVKEGAIRFYGASNFSAARLREAKAYADAHGLTGFSAVSNQHSVARVNAGGNTNPDPSLVIHREAEEAFHRETGTLLIPYQSTARGYFAKLAAGAAVPEGLSRAYDNEENRRMLGALREKAETLGCSVQTAALIALTECPYPVIPITSVSRAEQLSDVFDAMAHLGKR